MQVVLSVTVTKAMFPDAGMMVLFLEEKELAVLQVVQIMQ